MEFLRHSKQLTNGRRITVGAVYNQDSHTFSFGLAICKPGKAFCKKDARNRALGRAISNTPVDIIHVPSPDRNDNMLRDLFHRTADLLQANKNAEIELRIAAGHHTGRIVRMA